MSNAAAPKLTRATVKDPATGNYVPIDPAANYNVIVTNYIQEGGSGYALLQNVTVLVAFAEIQPDDVVEYLAAVSPYPGKTDGRVVITPPPA